MNLRTILFSQYPALFLLAVLFLIAHLRVRKTSAVKSVLWVILFGVALAASVVCCFLGIQAELWTLKTLITLGFWSWFGVGLVLLFLVLRVVHGVEKRSSRRRLDKAMKQAEKQKEEEVSRARAEGPAAERERAEAEAAPRAADCPGRGKRSRRSGSGGITMEQTGSQRVACYDVLRVAATFAVVALHLSAQHWADTDIYSTAWQAFNLYDSLVRWTVPVFVMISGVFFLAGTQSLRQILRKNVLRIVTAFVFWSALYAAYAYFFNKCALSTAVTLFFSGHYHMWFLFMIVGLYLIVPLLRPIAQNETLLRYFLLLALVFNFLLPQLGALLSLFSWPLYSSYLSLSGMLYYHFTLGFAAYFMLGRYLSRKELSPKAARWCYALGVAGLIVTVVMTSYASRRLGTATVLFYNYDSVGVLLMCLAVFVFARRHLNFPSLGEKGHARIRALSRWSFGAYLVHPLFIETFDQFLGVNTLSCNAFFSVPLLTLLIGTLSFLVSALLSRVPIVNKYFV